MEYRLAQRFRHRMVLLLILCTSIICGRAQLLTADSLPEYNNLQNWAAHPYKHDLADSVPKPLRNNYHPDTAVDIFFIHPTSYLDQNLPFGWNAPLDNEDINHTTDNGSIFKQASIFNEAGRIFAPRYRQANYFAYITKDTLQALAAFDKAYADIRAAFQFYLKYYNNGRPIVIASHSQGSTHAKRLLKEFFDGQPLQSRLVVAYVVGMPVEPDYFSSLPSCGKPGQTGCVCSWRTFKEGHVSAYVEHEKFKAIVTNPLTWDADKPEASRQLNNGAVLLKFNKVLHHAAAATVHEGVLWTPKPHFFGNIFFTTTNYHIADYNLYYVSIRENVANRIRQFLQSSK